MYKQYSYNPPDAYIIRGRVSKIEFQNRYFGKRMRTDFYCLKNSRTDFTTPEGSKPIPQKCVIWQRTALSEGDELEMKGKFSKDVFYVYSFMVVKKAAEQKKFDFNSTEYSFFPSPLRGGD